jgi:hypothetical protein
VDDLVAKLKERADQERATGAYADADELAALELEPPDGLQAGFDLGGGGSRVRFRPELGFSSKRVVGPAITAVKKFNIRLLYYVLDDLAKQVDAAVLRLETALSAEMTARESDTARQDKALRRELEARESLREEIAALSERVQALEERRD